MAFQKRRGGREATKQNTLNKLKPHAEWDETDKRYYMPGEKAMKVPVVIKAQ